MSRQKTPTFPANMSSCHPASLPFPSDDVVEELPQTHCLIAWKGPDFCQTPPGYTSEEDKQMIFKTSFFLLTTPRKINGWNLRLWAPWKKKIIFQTIIFRFYLKLRGCSTGSIPSLFVRFLQHFICIQNTYSIPFR